MYNINTSKMHGIMGASVSEVYVCPWRRQIELAITVAPVLAPADLAYLSTDSYRRLMHAPFANVHYSYIAAFIVALFQS